MGGWVGKRQKRSKRRRITHPPTKKAREINQQSTRPPTHPPTHPLTPRYLIKIQGTRRHNNKGSDSQHRSPEVAEEVVDGDLGGWVVDRKIEEKEAGIGMSYCRP